jgi:DASS family divalent anion:Na+ symporter
LLSARFFWQKFRLIGTLSHYVILFAENQYWQGTMSIWQGDAALLFQNLAMHIKRAASVLFVILGVWISQTPPPVGLDVKAMYALGITVWAVGWWITKIIPEYVTGLLMCILWTTLKCVPFKTAFFNFSTSGWWIMVGAFALGVAAGKTGLLKRVSLWVITLFPATFTGQVWGLIGAGTIISPLIPSMNAKSILSAPIALGISDRLGMARKSSGANGLFGACYVGFVIMGHMFMSGSFGHYVLAGMLPEGYKTITWLEWLLWSLPWGIVTMLGMGFFIVFAYKPKEKNALPKEYSEEQLPSPGPMSKDEKTCLWVLIGTLLLWMTESFHNVSAGEVAIFAMCALLIFKVINHDDFKNGVEWPTLIFIGTLLNMASVFQALSIDKWLGTELKPLFIHVAGEPTLLVITLVLSVCLIKFIMLSLIASATIFVLILPPVMINFGIHPWITCMIAFAAGNIWYLSYMNPIYLCAHLGVKGEMAHHNSMVKLSAVYTMLCIAGFIVSIPYWRMLGLIK